MSRALDLLRSASSKPCTLIIAGAGYGKSTLLAAYAAQNRGVVRCDLAQHHRELVPFLHQFCQSLMGFDARLSSKLLHLIPERLIDAGTPQSGAVIAALVSILHIASKRHPMVILIDDYHVAHDNADIEQLLLGLLSPPTPTLRLIISSRSQPSLPLARLQAHGHVTLIGQADLTLTIEEACTIFDGTGATKQAVELIHARMEGWAMGMRLARQFIAAMPYEEHDAALTNLSGNTASLSNYLREEIFQRLPPDRQQFLLESSLLPTMTAAECDLILQRMDSAIHLQHLQHHQLFIAPVTGSPDRYRYHDLYTAFLHTLAYQNLSPQRQWDIIKRAVVEMERGDRVVEALNLLLEAKHWSDLVDLYNLHHADLMLKGELPALHRLGEAIPPAFRNASITTLMCLGSVRHAAGNLAGALVLFRQAVVLATNGAPPALLAETHAAVGTILEQQGAYPSAEDAYRRSLASEPNARATTGLANLAQFHGRWHDALALHEQALHLAMTDGDIGRQAAVMHNLGLCYSDWGRLSLARDWYERSLRLKETHGLIRGYAATANNLGMVETWVGRYETARSLLLRAIDTENTLGQQHRLSYALANLGELHEMDGDLEEAADLYLRSLDIKERIGDAYGTAYTLAQRARLAARQNDAATGYRLIAQARLLRGPIARSTELLMFHLVDGDLALAKDNLAAAHVCYTDALHIATEIDNGYAALNARWRLAHTNARLAQPYDELVALCQALAMTDDYALALARLQALYPVARPAVPLSHVASVISHPTPLRVNLLGGMSVWAGDELIAETRWKRRRSRALLAALVLSWPHSRERAELIDMIWPDVPTDTVDALFFAHLRDVRVALQPDLTRGSASTYVQSSGTRYSLILSAPWDGERLFSAADAARAAQQQPGSGALPHWQTVIALYIGPLLPEALFLEDDWLIAPRERLRSTALEACHAAATLLEQQNAFEEAIATWQHLLNIDTCDEHAHAALMRLYERLGRRSLALAQYRQCVDILQRDLDATPSAWVQALARQLWSDRSDGGQAIPHSRR